MGVSEDADSLLAFLRREAPLNGLDTLAFFVPQIAADLSIIHSLAFDSLGVDINEVLPRLDYCLSKAYVRYTSGQRYGFVRPDKLFNRLQMKSDGSGYARLFDYELKAHDYKQALEQISGGNRMGFLAESKPSSPIYEALKQRLAQSQQLWAVGPDSVLNMRICCGASATKTPLLISSISHIQVNPEWVIPHNIVKTDVARHAGDSSYFARNHYSIIDRSSGDTLNPVRVSSESLQSGKLRVSQKGGAGNSLGRIVFRFQNNFSVYLHDTNNRGAFQRDRRTLSHGCVRVQDPFGLACFLLPDLDERTLDRLRISMDIPPVTDKGREYLDEHAEDPRPFRLVNHRDVSPQVPVYLIYYTAYPNPASGVIDLWPDIYGYDAAITGAIKPFLLKQ